MGRCGAAATNVENSGGSLRIDGRIFALLKIIMKNAMKVNLRMVILAVPLLPIGRL